MRSLRVFSVSVFLCIAFFTKVSVADVPCITCGYTVDGNSWRMLVDTRMGASLPTSSSSLGACSVWSPSLSSSQKTPWFWIYQPSLHGFFRWKVTNSDTNMRCWYSEKTGLYSNCTGSPVKRFEQCEAGYELSSGNTSCQPCKQGYYKTGPSSPTIDWSNYVDSCAIKKMYVDEEPCKPCRAGTYSTTTAATSASVCKNCSAGYYSSAGSSSCTKCPAGTYSSYSGSSSCTKCASGYFQPLTGQSSCTLCTNGFRDNPSTYKTVCQAYVSAGYELWWESSGSPDYSRTERCDTGTWSSGRYVSIYKSYIRDTLLSGCTNCTNKPANSYYTSYGTSSNCPWACNAGYYKSGSSCVQCPKGTYSNAGATSCITCPLDFTDNPNPGQTSVDSCQKLVPAGYFVSSMSYPSSEEIFAGEGEFALFACSSGTYSTARLINFLETTSCSNCPSAYPSSASKSTSISACYKSVSAGYRLSSTSGTVSVCGSNTYKTAHNVYYGNLSSCTSCPSGYTTRGTAASYHNTKSDCKIDCAAGKRVTSIDKTCTTPTGSWYKSAHTVSAGSTSSYSTCATGYATPSTTNATDHDSVSDCKITCSGGSYLKTANASSCTNVGIGYWAPSSTISQGSTGVRTQCPVGMTTIGYGPGADEEGDCGRVLNIGSEKIYLRSEKKTTPSLNFSIGGTTYYGNMTTGTKGSLRLNYNSRTYSVYDDSM